MRSLRRAAFVSFAKKTNNLLFYILSDKVAEIKFITYNQSIVYCKLVGFYVFYYEIELDLISF